MGITHVIRGDDHLTNTARQQLLFEALGGPVAALGAPLHGARAGRRQAQQAPRRHGGGRLPRARLPARGDRELPGAARLVARRGRGAGARPPRARVRARQALAEPGGVRPRQARLARPRAHHGARAGGARAPLRGAAAGRDAAAGGGRARGRLPAVAGALRRRAGRGGGGARAASRAAGTRRRRARRRVAAGARRARCAPKRRSGWRPPAPATSSPPTAPGARSVPSAPATCSCRCASPSPPRSTARSCPSSSPRSTARPPSRDSTSSSPGTLPVSPRRRQETSRDPPLQLPDPAEGAVRAPRPRQGRRLLLRSHGLQPGARRQRAALRHLRRPPLVAHAIAASTSRW